MLGSYFIGSTSILPAAFFDQCTASVHKYAPLFLGGGCGSRDPLSVTERPPWQGVWAARFPGDEVLGVEWTIAC